KGCGENTGVQFTEVVYEGYGPEGVAILCDLLTENRNRTAGEVRKIFEVHGGNLGSTGCVAWMFERKGMFLISAERLDEERLLEIALDAGADDVKLNAGAYEVSCAPDVFQQVLDAFQSAQIETDVAEITRLPSTTVDLNAAAGVKVLKLMEALEDNEDVQSVTANFNIPDEIMNEVSEAL
ncbi:MAG: YebC/PmpR family DNA-binding transcriptional regulator, partial [Planctomycetaceae bacterium]